MNGKCAQTGAGDVLSLTVASPAIGIHIQQHNKQLLSVCGNSSLH